VVALARNAESEVAADIEITATTEDIADDGNESGDVDV
jgi:hypothetical protein